MNTKRIVAVMVELNAYHVATGKEPCRIPVEDITEISLSYGTVYLRDGREIKIAENRGIRFEEE